MKNYKIEDKQLENAAKQLKACNALLADCKKKADAAKEVISNRLKELRGVELSTLPIGELVNVEGILLVEIGKQNRFDAANFQTKHAELYQSFMKDFPTMKFKVLVSI